MASLTQKVIIPLLLALCALPSSHAQYEEYSVREPLMSGLHTFKDFFLDHVVKQSCKSVKFASSPLGGPASGIKAPTCITIGHDGRLYIGTRGGKIEVVSYNPISGKATARCSSPTVTNPEFKGKRSILGIAIDPRDKVIRPYAATSTPGFKKFVSSNKQTAWSNGAVVRFKATGSNTGICLVFEKRIISGLPVSNGDKGIHALLFAQNGDLLIAVPGVTNMGLPGKNLGAIWESELSSAVLSASVASGAFNGKVTYSSDSQPFTAKKKSGDVKVHASGLRNCFTMTMDSVGRVYGVDQGSNCNYGNAATSCAHFDLDKAFSADKGTYKDWPGKTFMPACPFPSGVGRPDKLVLINKGKYYGHPNLIRGGIECYWVDPKNNKEADGGPPPPGYQSGMSLLPSSATGVHMYRGNHFCGSLRGDLLISSYNKGFMLRVGVNGGSKTSGPTKINNSGDVALTEDAHGNLLVPQFATGGVSILKPNKGSKSGLFIAGVAPFRHGRAGGTPIIIGGSNFGSSPKVTIGNKDCEVTKSSDSEITCLVPPNAGPEDLEVSASGETETLKNAVLYMT